MMPRKSTKLKNFVIHSYSRFNEAGAMMPRKRMDEPVRFASAGTLQ